MQTSDSAERRRALDPSASFLVQAPAGSGKTELLIQRFLTLLAHVEQPHNVVAITFTRKAAGEMRERVLKALEEAREGRAPEAEHDRLTYELACRVLEHERSKGWNLREYPSRLQILTIDALCLSLTRRMPVTSGFGSAPDILENATELYREAARRTVAACEGHDDAALKVRKLLVHLDNHWEKAASLIEELLPSRHLWLPYLVDARTMRSRELREVLENNIARMVEVYLEPARNGLPEAPEARIMRLGRFAARNAESMSPLEGLNNYPQPEAAQLEQWRTLRNLLLTKGGDPRKVANAQIGFPAGSDAQKAELREVAQSLPEGCLGPLKKISEVPDPRYTDAQWEILLALFDVLLLAAAQLKLVFRERRLVDFPEISRAALDALGAYEDPSQLAYVLDGRIEHLLVDEFQDTSHGQWELLARLTSEWTPGDGRTLFSVGDPMQSIFRWRDADVNLFLQARRRGIGHLRLEPLTLTSNFRSDRQIVEWNNAAFATVFPEVEDERLGAVPLAPSHAAKRGTETGAVQVHPIFRWPDEDGVSEREAELVLRLIAKAREEKPEGKIALLFRARSHAAAIASALRTARVPFQAVEMDSLAESMVVRDLLSLTRALLHPADRVAWAAILRAPWCGLTLAELEAICKVNRYAPIQEILRAHRDKFELSEDGTPRLRAFWRVMEEALENRARLRVRAWVESTWVALGGPACLRTEAELADAEAFLDVLDQFERGGGISNTQELEARIEELFSKPDPSAGESLQLLTMHKAKGLQFDTVILAGLGRGRQSDSDKLLSWFQHGDTVVLAPMRAAAEDKDPLANFLAKINARCDAYEQARLLYVAATRAKTRLHVVGHVNVREKDAQLEMCTPFAGSMLHQLWPVVRETFEERFAAEAALRVSGGEQRAERPGRMLLRLPSGWQVPALQPRTSRRAAAAGGSAETGGTAFRWTGETPKLIGTAVHAIFEAISNDGLEDWDARRVEASSARWQFLLQEGGVPHSELPLALQTVRDCVESALKDEFGRNLLRPRAKATNEFAIAGVLDHAAAAGHYRIDRTFVDEEGTRWIVDYKTARPAPGEDVDDFLDAQLVTYREQLEGYAELMTEIDPAHPVRLVLYFPLVSGWREWSYQKAFTLTAGD